LYILGPLFVRRTGKHRRQFLPQKFQRRSCTPEFPVAT
jgi:hypothetical protein